MRQSRLFGKTLRDNPKDEVSKNSILLERGGFIYKTMAGVYDFLPLGLRVLSKINAIIREEMNSIGGQELFMSAFQPKERWEKTERWETAKDVMYRVKDEGGREFGLGFTHEEAIAEIATQSIFSYKDLPLYVYQIQTKFRNEPRAKSGLIRGREFIMKDLYSFTADEASLDEFYERARAAYTKIFSRMGLHAYVTEASGGSFTKQFSHEFQVLSEAGEDWLLYCKECSYAQNKEISSMTEGGKCPKCGGAVHLSRSIEVGNIFKLGTRFSDAFGLMYTDEKGDKKPVVMGSYGIGPGRLMGTIAEVKHDDKGIIWPENVAPFTAHIIPVHGKDAVAAEDVRKNAEKLYGDLIQAGIDVLYDDREDKSAGQKFADADLLGIPYRIVVSEKTLTENAAELKKRSSESAENVQLTEIIQRLP